MPFRHPGFGAPARRRRFARPQRVLLIGAALVASSIPTSARAGAHVEPTPLAPAASVAAADPVIGAELVPVAVALSSANAEAAAVEAALRRERAGMECPIAGTVRFYDDFGNPRSGGRRHEGNDLMTEHGTPLVAVVDGALEFKSGSRQGRGAYLKGADGNEYWYFHLAAYEGEARLVRQGEVIGYAGNTGNAGGTHLHFEVHPGWDPYEVVNPYPRLDVVCTDRVSMT
jgi:murein DD-endopeptidase MepM/ murein hydrolase activator NlpD